MTKRFDKWPVICALAILPLFMAGCFDFGTPDDVTNAQEKMRLNRAAPAPTELPPGLGEDLPAATQPQTTTH